MDNMTQSLSDIVAKLDLVVLRPNSGWIVIQVTYIFWTCRRSSSISRVSCELGRVSGFWKSREFGFLYHYLFRKVVFYQTLLMIKRRDFDCTVNSEPYHVLHLVADLNSGLFFIRVLGKTFARGSVKAEGDVKLVEDFEGDVKLVEDFSEGLEKLIYSVFDQVIMS